MKKLQCATLEGIEAIPVSVESTLTKGLPSFTIVGMASTAINEARERVKSALLSNDFVFPPKRITINLSPSDVNKNGSHFDLSIALLIALDSAETDLSTWHVFGELGLDGRVKENALLYPLVLSLANNANMQKVLVPKESLSKVRNIPNIEFIGVEHLNDAIAFFKGDDEKVVRQDSTEIDHPHYTIHKETYYFQKHYPIDFIDIKGQENAKRAALVSASGLHNLLLEGSPGCGKSMIAKRLHYILPPVTSNELLDIAKLDSLDGVEPHFTPLRPFRSPHHTSTPASVFGGGSHKAQIGEIGLAHNGILFFDELPHFQKPVLEALREPLEDKKIRISRVNTKVEYPTSFLFIAAMNPCPCGNLLSTTQDCRCSEREILRYKNRLSDPFLDRIDLYVQMQNIHPDDTSSFSSESLHRQVLYAHKRQMAREQKCLNGQLEDSSIDKYCSLDDDVKTILDQAVIRYQLSFRSIKKIQKVARTIADLDNADTILKSHLLEALSYRRRER
ncbi:MAG: YifB family Mg chelatase-like AAA ATPase [Helicobacteraceae bacterium]|jgi:magnesium chelatase family protein|nr:YifB family Mg chelatase-like AAA ATPase [Helicobacteraceae bacterium]